MITRRRFVQNGLVAIASLAPLISHALPISRLALTTRRDTKLGATIPEGARLRIVARSGEIVPGTKHEWHHFPDGGATFATPEGGWIYVSNSERPFGKGGVGALRFAADGRIEDAYTILTETTRNCAGGKTPWNTWLSCEENGDLGQVYECDPFGKEKAKVRPGLGSCNHEAAAVDPRSGQVYLTEDVRAGCLYRFTPDTLEDLSKGVLEVGVLEIDEAGGKRLGWERLPDPGATNIPLRLQIKGAAKFDGGEGIVYSDGKVFFTTKQDDRVWSLDLDSSELKIVYDRATSATPILSGVDNIEVSQDGELLVAEDGDDMQIVILDKDLKAIPLVTLHDQSFSEITGPAFSPDGRRLYFSSQKGTLGNPYGGKTYELILPETGDV